LIAFLYFKCNAARCCRQFSHRDEEFPADRPPCRDRKDNQFLGLAFECEANVIVSSDEDLLVLDPWGDTRILRPAEFVEAMK
jgi:predicted nucleic acid-binding protein